MKKIENITGLVEEEELMDLAGGTGDASTYKLSPLSDIVTIVTDYVCPSSACTSSGYCQ